jgi:hypothetical protein
MHSRLPGIVPGALATPAAAGRRGIPARRLALAGPSWPRWVCARVPAGAARPGDDARRSAFRMPFRFATVAGSARLRAAASSSSGCGPTRAPRPAAALCGARRRDARPVLLSGVRDPIAGFGPERAQYEAVGATARADGADRSSCCRSSTRTRSDTAQVPRSASSSDDMTSSNGTGCRSSAGTRAIRRPSPRARGGGARAAAERRASTSHRPHPRRLVSCAARLLSDPTVPERIPALPWASRRGSSATAGCSRASTGRSGGRSGRRRPGRGSGQA